MNHQSLQIVKGYEEAGLDIESLSEFTGLESTEIKAVLLTHSAKYRKDCKMEGPTSALNFTDDDNQVALHVIRSAMNSEDENLAFRAAKFARNDAKGRLDNVSKELASLTSAVSEFNLHIKRARMARELTANEEPKQVIEVG